MGNRIFTSWRPWKSNVSNVSSNVTATRCNVNVASPYKGGNFSGHVTLDVQTRHVERLEMTTQKPLPEIWVLKFRSAPGFTYPANRRMARLLKCALRSFGFICTDVAGEHPAPEPGLDVTRDEPPFA